MFPLTFSFHDSEVKHIRREQHMVRVVFSAARVSRASPDRGDFDGFALGLELQLIGVMGAPPHLDAFGRLSSGRLSVGGPAKSSLVLPSLPFEWAGQTTLEMVFSQGGDWSATALKVKLDWVDEERFLEGVGC
jgi:hypothetical protein